MINLVFFFLICINLYHEWMNLTPEHGLIYGVLLTLSFISSCLSVHETLEEKSLG